MRSSLLSLAAAALGVAALSPVGAAQVCGTDTFFQNDSLPASPSGPITVSVIPGLCEDEAAGSIFQLPNGTPQKLNVVSVGFGAANGASGATAIVNVEIYDGVTLNGGQATLGPKVFDYAIASGGNLQVTSTAINELDISSYNVVVGNNGDDDFVVAFRMLINPNGNCTTGFTTNFFTDNTQPGLFGCDANITPPGKNLIDITGQGWSDVTTASVSGVPLCPLFYSGNWAIRACGADAGSGNPLQVQVAQNPTPPGGFVNLEFKAPGYNGVPYVAAASGGNSPGFPVLSGSPAEVGIVPLNPDGLFTLSLNTPSVFLNFSGVIGSTGTAPGIIAVPNDPALSGLEFYVAFIALTPSPSPYGISDAALVQIQ